jgi:hypothetical protein
MFITVKRMYSRNLATHTIVFWIHSYFDIRSKCYVRWQQVESKEHDELSGCEEAEGLRISWKIEDEFYQGCVGKWQQHYNYLCVEGWETKKV